MSKKLKSLEGDENISESSYPYVNINGLIDMKRATVKKLRAKVSKLSQWNKDVLNRHF